MQASAVPALERLGVLEELEAAGAVRGHARVWSPYGWFGEPSAPSGGSLSIRREKLDPLLRRRAAETPGVELMLGHALTGTAPAAGRRVELPAAPRSPRGCVIGADGRGSRTASLAGVRDRARAPTPASPTGATSRARRSAPARACTCGSSVATSASPRRPTAA